MTCTHLMIGCCTHDGVDIDRPTHEQCARCLKYDGPLRGAGDRVHDFARKILPPCIADAACTGCGARMSWLNRHAPSKAPPPERTPRPLEEMQRHAEAARAVLAPICKGIEIVGGVRRQRPEVCDIDLLVIGGRGFGGKLAKVAQASGWRRTLKGREADPVNERYWQFVTPAPGSPGSDGVPGVTGVVIEIIATSEAGWPFEMVFRTGPAALSVPLVESRLWRQGECIHRSIVHDSKGKPLGLTTEREVMERIAGGWLPPEDRDAWIAPGNESEAA